MDEDAHKKLDKILEELISLKARVALIETGGNAPSATSGRSSTGAAAGKKLAIKEFLLKYPPTNDVERTLAVGYFLENHAGMASFNKADLEQGYQDAKVKPPSNVHMNVNRCIANGHMMEARQKKNNKTAWELTSTGEEFVLAGFKKPSSGK